MAGSHVKIGDWNAICDVCGFKFKASQLKKRWDGRMVCRDDWETRHPQDLIKIPKDLQNPPWVRPEVADTFITITYADGVVTGSSAVCTYLSSLGLADQGTSDCSRADTTY
jgi:hypothetical protein